jgi:hypothetical protein
VRERDVPVSGGGAFSAANVGLPTQAYSLCRLVAVPHGVLPPTDPSPFTGPRLRLMGVITTGLGTLQDNKSGSNHGKEFNFAAGTGGTAGDAFLTSAADAGVESTNLVSPLPGEQGRVFSSSDVISATDPATGPDHDNTSTGLTVDGNNTYLGPSWEDAVTPALEAVFGSYSPFPTVGAAPSLDGAGNLGVTEHDLVVRCGSGLDINYYEPQGATCTSLADTGVALDLATMISPAGTVITRRWTLRSTDHAAHQVRLVLLEQAAGTRTWRLPGEAGYSAHVAGDQPAPPASAPWTVRLHTEGAADGDVTKGVGAVTSTLKPTALRFTGSRMLAVTYAFTVPADGVAELGTTVMSEATQAALEADIAAAEGGGTSGGGGNGGGGSGDSGGTGGGGQPAGPAVPAPAKPTPLVPLPKAARVLVLQSEKTCVSRRRLVLHLHPPAGTRITRLTVKVAHRTTHPKLRGTAPVVLAGLPKGRYAVRVQATFADGRTLTLTRRYRTCAPKRRR